MAKNIEIIESKEKQEVNNETPQVKEDKNFNKQQREKFNKVNSERKQEDEVEKPKKLTRLNKKLEEQKLQDEFAKQRGSIEKLQGVEIEVKGTKYPFKFETFTIDGKQKMGHEVQKNLNDGHVTIKSGRVKARIKLEGGEKGTKMTVDIPIQELLKGDAKSYIKTTCEDIFGGALEWYNKQKQNKPAKKEENKEYQEKKQTIKEKAQQHRGTVAIFEREGLTSIFIKPKQGKQVKLSTVTGSVWEAEEGNEKQDIKQENIIEYLDSSVET